MEEEECLELGIIFLVMALFVLVIILSQLWLKNQNILEKNADLEQELCIARLEPIPCSSVVEISHKDQGTQILRRDFFFCLNDSEKKRYSFHVGIDTYDLSFQTYNLTEIVPIWECNESYYSKSVTEHYPPHSSALSPQKRIVGRRG